MLKTLKVVFEATKDAKNDIIGPMNVNVLIGEKLNFIF
jgi:hypothetical protein